MHRVVAETPRQLSLPGRRVPSDLETICLKCLRKQPTRRYITAADLANDLARFLAGEAISARRLNGLEWALHWVTHHPRKAVVGVLVFLLAIYAGVVTWLLLRAWADLEALSTTIGSSRLSD
jgi:hypothetical protein